MMKDEDFQKLSAMEIWKLMKDDVAFKEWVQKTYPGAYTAAGLQGAASTAFNTPEMQRVRAKMLEVTSTALSATNKSVVDSFVNSPSRKKIMDQIAKAGPRIEPGPSIRPIPLRKEGDTYNITVINHCKDCCTCVRKEGSTD